MPNKKCPYCGTRLFYFNDKQSWKMATISAAQPEGKYDVIIKCRKCRELIGVNIKQTKTVRC